MGLVDVGWAGLRCVVEVGWVGLKEGKKSKL